MTMTMYTASAPVFARMLRNMDRWLEKAEAHAEAKKFESRIYLQSRLAPDMLALTNQVQIACDAAKFAVARLSGTEAPKFPDDEASVAELRERIARTLEWVESVPVSAIEGADAREIEVPVRGRALRMTGEAYLKNFALPNFYFHATITYALLRHNGVELGKPDFIGGLE